MTPALLASACAAVVFPTLLAMNLAPSPTFLNQALAFGGWGLLAWMALAAGGLPSTSAAPARLSGNLPHSAPWHRGALAGWPLLAALGLLGLSAAASGLCRSLPAPLAWSGLLSLVAAGLLAALAVRLAQGPRATAIFAALASAWLLAGLLNVGIAAVQVFAPQWADGVWIARSGIPGRAVGNLRQPNHLSSLLLWACIHGVGLLELRRLQGIGPASRSLRPSGAALDGAAGLLMALLVLGIVLTASRTGVVGVGLLALWGLADRRLALPTRHLLGATPLLYGAFWLLMAAWATWAQASFGGEQRLAEADLSASRFAIWADTLSLIRAHPWWGVGFGEFNFAWSLALMPNRPGAFFDHTHNLPLHLAAELGLPLAALVLGLLMWAWWMSARGSLAVPGEAGVAARCSAAMVTLIALHSLLEYPLWYAYFLLPTVWAMGWGLGAAGGVSRGQQHGLVGSRSNANGACDFQSKDESEHEGGVESNHVGNSGGRGRGGGADAARTVGSASAQALRRRQMAWGAASLGLLVGAAWSVHDYARVVPIFAEVGSQQPLAARVAEGRRSVFFSHHADYAAATVGLDPNHSLEAYGRAAHYLLDTRLLSGWAQAYADAGDADRAAHLVQRLREFKNPQSAEFFAPCALVGAASAATRATDVAPSAAAGLAPGLASGSDASAANAPAVGPPDPPFQCAGRNLRQGWQAFRAP